MRKLNPRQSRSRTGLPRVEEQAGTYFVTFSLRPKSERLSFPEREVVFDIIVFGHEKRYDLHAAVVMPDHVHILFQAALSPSLSFSLSKIMHRIKGLSAYKVNRLRGRKGPLWLSRYHNRLINSDKEYRQKLRYIIDNPVRSDLTETPDEYPYLWYRGKEYSE